MKNHPTLQQLLDKRRTELGIKQLRSTYAESVKVDFVAVLERHFSKISERDAA